MKDDTTFDIKDYFKPKSVTWWGGVFALVSAGTFYFWGDSDTAATLAAIGASAIGIRAKLGRV